MYTHVCRYTHVCIPTSICVLSQPLLEQFEARGAYPLIVILIVTTIVPMISIVILVVVIMIIITLTQHIIICCRSEPSELCGTSSCVLLSYVCMWMCILYACVYVYIYIYTHTCILYIERYCYGIYTHAFISYVYHTRATRTALNARDDAGWMLMSVAPAVSCPETPSWWCIEGYELIAGTTDLLTWLQQMSAYSAGHSLTVFIVAQPITA